MQGSVSSDKRESFQIPAIDKENRTLLADYHYSYDGNGNRTGKEGLTGKTSYQYDTLNRLVKVQYPKGLEEFTYDKADNRIRRLTEKEEELYRYDVCNRLTEKQTRRISDNMAGTSENAGSSIKLENTAAVPQGANIAATSQSGAKTPKGHFTELGKVIPYKTSTFQYDNQGNLLREERKTEGNPQESIYSYDGFNRQKKIVNFENKVQVNHYDGEGLRHEMEENGKLVKFLYNDREAVAEEKEDGNIIRFIRGYDLVASDSESARTYYHYSSDEQGSITHVLGEDKDGEYSLKNYYEYGAFGDFREQYEEAENRFGYNGEIFDPIGGQYYLRARYYNPVIGRFTQEDTYYGAGLNLYAYCRNLPIGYTDPSGHYPCQEKQDLYKKYREQGYNAQDANRMANYELIRKNQGIDAAETYLRNEQHKDGRKPDGVTYEGPLYRNVGTMPDGTPVNPLEISDFTKSQNYRYTQNGQNGLYFASNQHVMEGEMGAYGSNPYADNRTTYRYDNVTLNNMLDLTNPNTRDKLGVELSDLISSDYKKYTTTAPSPAVTHSMGNFAAKNGYTGLIVPSARADGGVNIVIFNPKGIDFGTYTTIHDKY